MTTAFQVQPTHPSLPPSLPSSLPPSSPDGPRHLEVLVVVQGALLEELAHLLQVLDVQGGQGDADAVDLRGRGGGREGGREGRWVGEFDCRRHAQAVATRLGLLSHFTCNSMICQPQMTHSLPLLPRFLPPSLPLYLLVILSEGLGLDNVGHVTNLRRRGWKKKKRECWTRRCIGGSGEEGGREGGREGKVSEGVNA